MAEDRKLASASRAHRTETYKRGFAAAVAAVGLMIATPTALAADVTGSVEIATGPFAPNSASNTLDAQVTVWNRSAHPLSGPLKLTVDQASPVGVTLYNSYGTTSNGTAYLELPVPDGLLAPGGYTKSVVKLISPTGSLGKVSFKADANLLMESAQISLKGYRISDDGRTVLPVGPGYKVRVNGYLRGQTDINGRLNLLVPAAATTISAEGGDGLRGQRHFASLYAGQKVIADIQVHEGVELYGDAKLRFDQVRNGILRRNAPALTLQFLDHESPIRVTRLIDATAKDQIGRPLNVSSLFTVQPDGSLSASPSRFYSTLGARPGRTTLAIDAMDDKGGTYSSSVSFHFSDYRAKVQLIAPPSNLGLSLAGLTVSGKILNSGIRFEAQSDANGIVSLPDVPGGVLNLSVRTASGSASYVGIGSIPISMNSLVRLTLRSPGDIFNGVPAISVVPLPPGSKSLSARDSTPRPVYGDAELAKRKELAAKFKARAFPSKVNRRMKGDDGVVNIEVRSDAQGEPVEDAAQLLVRQGTKKVVLTYQVQSAEYPYFVNSQSMFNDAWSVTVLDQAGIPLFDSVQQVNAQLLEEPIWSTAPGGLTANIHVALDVTTLAAQSDTTLTLKGTSLNVGDSLLPTILFAKLDSTDPLVITNTEADSIESVNNGTYYSVPRSGEGNLRQRTYTIEVSKGPRATLTHVAVDLLDRYDFVLMPILLDTAPGGDGVAILEQTDTSVRLQVRVTVSNPASTVPGVPPPTKDIGFRFTVKATEEGQDIREERIVRGKRALWHMPAGLNRYGHRDDGYDDWTVLGAYNWMVENREAYRAVDDVSGEHGINIGHRQSHGGGLQIDTFHFHDFPGGTGTGADEHIQLRSNLITAFGTVGTDSPPPEATAALGQINTWVTNTRAGISRLSAMPTVATLFYCLGAASNGLPEGWCRQLLTAGTASRTVRGPNGQPLVQTLDLQVEAFQDEKLRNDHVHNSHLHINLDPSVDQ